MGCYGIGVTRIVAAAIEQNHDKDGIIWPSSIAPYLVVITLIDTNLEAAVAVANRLYQEMQNANIDVIYDDRDERPGVKFKDADLLGFPVRITIGSQGLAEGVVEIRDRKSGKTEKIKPEHALDFVKQMLRNG
jgi:prolyl-tRNA synthetase